MTTTTTHPTHTRPAEMRVTVTRTPLWNNSGFHWQAGPFGLTLDNLRVMARSGQRVAFRYW